MKRIALLLPILLIFIFTTAMSYDYHGPEVELITFINKERQSNGIPPLLINWEVTRLARYKSEEMVNHGLFDHESLVYGNPAQLLDSFHIGYSYAGANIAMGHETPEDVLSAWNSSPGHKANIFNPNFLSAGVGLSYDDDDIPYWTIILVD